jgi:hypothetical protein
MAPSTRLQVVLRVLLAVTLVVAVTGDPCCDDLRENPVFCCLEARVPEFALSVCNQTC